MLVLKDAFFVNFNETSYGLQFYIETRKMFMGFCLKRHGLYFIADLTLPYGRVIYDYLNEN